MEFHLGRILGIVFGLVILATIFLVPFGTSNSATLYGVAGPLISGLGALQSSGNAASVTYGYIWIIAFVLLVIAGLVGIFPLGTGVLGVVGMALVTAAPYLVYPNGPVKLDSGIGFYVIWVVSIASLGASFWHRLKKGPAGEVNVEVTQTQTVGGPVAQIESPAAQGESQVKCPNCGKMNPAGASKCSACGENLPESML